MALSSRIRTGAEVFEITLSPTDIFNRFITLPMAPFTPAKVTVDVIGGGAQMQFVDYVIINSSILWNAMGLETILSVNDRLRIVYYK